MKSQLISKLQACGINTDPQALKLAESLVKLKDCIDNLDMISLPLESFRFLKTYPELSKNKKKEDMIIAFYRYFIPKDIDSIEELLGRCIQPKTTSKDFLNNNIDISKIPKIQKDLINFSKNTYTDPITLQQEPLSRVVQLKESGEIMTMDSFLEIIKRNTSLWQGKQNVGFMSPITNTMMGNPVSFNFDKINFFPQRPGTLTITRIKNIKKTPSTLKPLDIPSHYFQLTYKGYTFFLPDTPAGRRILFMMKDCYKKGNLFGLDSSGRVRHGRVHKKTNIIGTMFSYPDDTYLERVSGELQSLGSSLYTYRFSKDPLFTLASDPYPDEERFLIAYR